MFGEPPKTDYDLRFNISDIPVRVHPFFWLLSFVLGMNNTGPELIIWIGVVFFSILIHELGHALVIRYFGWSPWIVLHSFGGLAIYDPNFSPNFGGRRPKRTHLTQILISLAGPAAGFALAAVVVAILFATQHEMVLGIFGRRVQFGSGNLISNDNLEILVFQLLYVNIFWGLLNLVPIYPLDGGQVARELFAANSNDGIRKSLQLSLATASVIAAIAIFGYNRMYLGLMFGYMAYNNYQQLNPHGGGGFGRRL